MSFELGKRNGPGVLPGPCYHRGGEAGIRTPDTLVGYTHLAGEHLRPLGHFSVL